MTKIDENEKANLRLIFLSFTVLFNLFGLFLKIIEYKNCQNFISQQISSKYEFLFIVAAAIKTIIICRCLINKNFGFLYWGGVFVNVIVIFSSEINLHDETFSQNELFIFFRCYLINTLFFLCEIYFLTNQIKLFD